MNVCIIITSLIIVSGVVFVIRDIKKQVKKSMI